MKKVHASKAQSRPKSRGGMLLGLFIGLVVGVVAAFGVVWYLNKTPLPFQDKSSRAEKAAERPNGKTPDQLPGKPGDKVGERPRFEFYKILPGGQEATPSTAPVAPAPSAAAPAPLPPPAAEASPAASDIFYLQTGAFQKADDADNQKARLSMLGLDVAVQEATVADKGKMFRVRVGPFAKPEEMNRVRNQLAQNGIQATVVKIKQAPKN